MIGACVVQSLVAAWHQVRGRRVHKHHPRKCPGGAKELKKRDLPPGRRHTPPYKPSLYPSFSSLPTSNRPGSEALGVAGEGVAGLLYVPSSSSCYRVRRRHPLFLRVGRRHFGRERSEDRSETVAQFHRLHFWHEVLGQVCMCVRVCICLSHKKWIGFENLALEQGCFD